MEQNLVIGVDIGGQTAKCGVVDARGTVICQTVIRSDQHAEAEPFIAELAVALKRIVKDAGAEGRIRGIGVGAPNANYYTGTSRMPSISPGAVRAPSISLPCSRMRWTASLSP